MILHITAGLPTTNELKRRIKRYWPNRSLHSHELWRAFALTLRGRLHFKIVKWMLTLCRSLFFLQNLPVRGKHNEHCDWGCHITITLLLRKSEVCQYTEAPKSQLLKRKIAAIAGNWIQVLDFWSKSNSRHVFNLISIFHLEMAAGIGSNTPKTELDKRWRKRMAGWMHWNISH